MFKFIIWFLLMIIPVTAWAIDVNVLAIVQDGSMRTTGKYFAFGGNATADAPAFENRYLSDYSAIGTAGLAMQNSFSGAMEVREQFELQSGHGRFLTKAGTGVLVNVPVESADGEEQIIEGRLVQNAVGFGGFMTQGIVLTTFSTANGLIGKSESEGIGEFRAGGIQKIETGTSIPGTGPIVVEYQEAHWRFDGTYKVQVEIIFPK